MIGSTRQSDLVSGIAVVVPAFNAERTLGACLSAIARSTRKPDEIILFDDGSTDRTAEIARAHGARVIRTANRAQGPAVGRNAGAIAAQMPILVFVDADVIVENDAIARLVAPIADRSASATFGSYNMRPQCRNVAAFYYNLRHHWVHQQGRSEAFTFWSGFGAIRRDVFLHAGGFDARFRQPSIEDIDLGLRIIEAGDKIGLIKNAQATHCKDWTLRQLWHTDIFRRAIPWALLLKAGRGNSNDLNISNRERLSAVVAHLIWMLAIATVIAPVLWPLSIAGIVAYIAMNAAFFSYLYRTVGAGKATGGIVLHWCYHLYASVTFVLVKLWPDRVTRTDAAVSPT